MNPKFSCSEQMLTIFFEKKVQLLYLPLNSTLISLRRGWGEINQLPDFNLSPRTHIHKVKIDQGVGKPKCFLVVSHANFV